MKTLMVGLPDALAAKLTALVEEGWFTSEPEIVRLALADFIRHRPFELQDRFQREGVARPFEHMARGREACLGPEHGSILRS
jgi:Arc/MetJ-type ribon-helix-helix transcriptional regulator